MSHGDVVLAYRKSIFHPSPPHAPTPPADNPSSSAVASKAGDPARPNHAAVPPSTSPLAAAAAARARPESRDSNVQYAPATNKFENVKFQAIHLWKSGVDLELQQAPLPKKKPATWLTESEFQNLTNAPEPLRIQTRDTSRSFAQAVVSPAWAPEDEPDQEAQPFVTRTAAPPSTLGVGNVASVDQATNLRMYQAMYAIQSNLLGHNTLASFYDTMDYYMNQSPRMSERTFAMLIDTLVSVAAQDKCNTGDHRRVFNRMIPRLAAFVQAVEGYLAVYALTPREMMPLLELSSMFANACPRSASWIPLDSIRRSYESIKHVFSQPLAVQAQALIRDIQSSHSAHDGKLDDTRWSSKRKSAGEDHWWRTIGHLPSFPDGQALFDQTVGRQRKQDSALERCINIVQNHPGFRVYLLTQYILLWEELCQPIQRGMQRLMARDFTSSQDDGCSMYIHLSVFGTTFLPTFNQPVVILDALAGNYVPAPREGSLAVLIAEDNSKSVLTGVVAFGITALKKPPTLIIGIHLDNLLAIDGSRRYTLLATGTNAAAALPALKWFQSSYEQPSEHPPILAPRLLSPSQHHEGNQEMPDYLEQMELDLSCITRQPQKAHMGVKGQAVKWPKHAEPELALAPSQRRRLYDLSASQVAAVQHALTHRVSVISGGQGTGKSFLAAKLVQILHQALVSGQCFQPILVLTKNENTLDAILGQVLQHVPQLVRLGKEIHGSHALVDRQALVAASPATNDPHRNNVLGNERRLAILQAQLNALWKYRRRVAEGDVSIMVTTIPPDYAAALERGYAEETGSTVEGGSKGCAMQEVFDHWLGVSERNSEYPEFNATCTALHATTLRETGKYIPPILDQKTFSERRNWIEKRTPVVLSIAEATQWPFKSSDDARSVRSAMRHAWTSTPTDHLWTLSTQQRVELRQRVIDRLIQIVEGHINSLLSQQMHASQVVEEARLQKWTSTCRFSRVIGVTAEFASAHAKVIESLWPRIVLIDEANLILESIVAPFVLGSRVQHLIMMGDTVRQQPKVFNPKLRNEPKYFDISLFDRWKLANGFINKLEEQWRMCPDIANIHDALPDADRSKLLITAPMAGENRCDALQLLGLECRAYFIDYHAPYPSTGIDPKASALINQSIKVDDAGEARFVARFAMYLYQQKHKPANIALLTLSRLQKVLVQHVISELAKSSFTTTAICVETVENYAGRENEFVILSLAMPCGRPVPENAVSLSLSRAKSGLYIVGKVAHLAHTAWDSLAQYMKDRKLCGPNIKLHCQKHPDQVTMVGTCEDFENVKNGGCTELCNTLLDCGHVCTEPCHHLRHVEAMCKQQCERRRINGCTHKCPNKCYQCRNKCPDCVQVVQIKRPCGHTISGFCYRIDELARATKCTQTIKHTLPCGHNRMIECHQADGEISCDETIQIALDCGHTVTTQCCYKPVCTERCPGRLDCGHSCPEKCGTDHQTHQRAVCNASCSKQLICGHYCAKGCANPDEHTDRCLEQCQHVCSHGYGCGRDCWQVCNGCVQPCPYSCEHLECTKKCFERCDRPPCNQHCQKKLKCGHACIGLCGEPCPPCKECAPDRTCSISLRSLSEFEKDEIAYMLPECGCVFAVDSLDLYFQTQAKNGEHTAIKLWQCPSCQKPIYTAMRYNLLIKTEIALVNQIKEQQEIARQKISQKEKTDIIQAMNEETKTSINNIVGGRWFVCENGHPYFIGDCGGATEMSKCPHCGAVIGGLQHKVVESNRFYGEFDGSFDPAWPGQPR